VTLSRFILSMVTLLALVAGGVLSLAVSSAGGVIVQTGEAARVERARQVSASVDAELGRAEQALEDIERGLAARLIDGRDPDSVARALTFELLAVHPLTDLTFTAAMVERYADGEAILAPNGRWQVRAFRDEQGNVRQRSTRDFTPGAPGDPTLHDTFRAAAREDSRGQTLWSDIAFSDLDAALPPARRRKTLTVQRALASGPAGIAFLGVLRAGLTSETLDGIGSRRAPGDPHQTFICDAAGRLVTRLSPHDGYVALDPEGHPDPDGDLRVAPSAPLPPGIGAALAFARERGDATTAAGKRMLVAGTPTYLTLLPVAPGRAQGWFVGVVVPESAYVGPLATARDRLLLLLLAVVTVMLIVGLAGARTVRRGVDALVRSTEAMRRFRFDAAPPAPAPRFAELGAALDSVERAKTALRAMVKYVPIDLVRRLYEQGRDPVLGASPVELTVMFTDIADFTTHAEALSPQRLAQALGRYLATATTAVEANGGTVDKYIGDALMVLWNAPEPCPDHPAAACRAALACAAATHALVTAVPWREAGLLPWRTRFGLHTDRVLVGNFGAPDRLSYTAMGDGVNLASRLEGLNKVYGTTIIASQPVRDAAGDRFVFRRLDRVAVKGKQRAVWIYELCGAAGDPAVEQRRDELARYEAALEQAQARRFTDALRTLARAPPGPAALLAERCREWLRAPPPRDWDGTWTATSK